MRCQAGRTKQSGTAQFLSIKILTDLSESKISDEKARSACLRCR